MRRERLRFFKADHVAVVEADAEHGGVLRVVETAEDGRAEVRFSVSPGCLGLGFVLSEGVKISFLADTKSADGHMLVQEKDGSWTAHVVECKATVRSKDWTKAQKQLVAGMLRLQIVADFLGVEIARWRGHVAFRNDLLSPRRTPDLAFLEAPLGRDPADEEQLRQRQSWALGQIQGVSFVATLPVHKVQLDSAGEAQVAL